MTKPLIGQRWLYTSNNYKFMFEITHTTNNSFNSTVKQVYYGISVGSPYNYCGFDDIDMDKIKELILLKGQNKSI